MSSYFRTNFGGVTHELVEAGKEGTIYVINRDQMTAAICIIVRRGATTGIRRLHKRYRRKLTGYGARLLTSTAQFISAGSRIPLKAFPLSDGVLRLRRAKPPI